MARSGYPEGYRVEVIKSGVTGFERQLEASQKGEKPLFRPRDWQKDERRKHKLARKVSWYRPADCVGFFPPSPRGELVSEINKVLEGRRIGVRMKAIETGGLSLAKQLVKPDLRRGEPCGRPGCVLDRTSGGAGGPHNIPSSLYRGGCYVKLQENPENIGARADSQDATDAVVTIQMWSPERRQMLLPSILHYSTQITRATSRTLISR